MTETVDTAPSVTVAPVRSRSARRDWLEVPHIVFADDPVFVPQLHSQEQRRISTRANPFFRHGTAEFFVAYRDGRPAGRISAQVNRRHLDRYGDNTGHFGFFDSIDDQAVTDALVETARSWLGGKGLTRMVGPFNLSINEEVGVLVEGFDTPPAVLMPHSGQWYDARLKAAGLAKAMDMFAYRLDPAATPEVITKLAQRALASDRITMRRFDMRRYADEVRLLVDIFNDSWSANWGFVPFSEAEVDALVAETRYFLHDAMGRFVLLDGREVGFMFVVPNFNDVIGKFRGRLLPFHWLTMLRHLRRADWRSMRIPLMGLRQSVQRTHAAPGLFALMFDGFARESRNYPIDWAEISWVLESNRSMVQLAELFGGTPVKRYRVYEGLTATTGV